MEGGVITLELLIVNISVNNVKITTIKPTTVKPTTKPTALTSKAGIQLLYTMAYFYTVILGRKVLPAAIGKSSNL